MFNLPDFFSLSCFLPVKNLHFSVAGRETYMSLGGWDREPWSCVQEPLCIYPHSRDRSVLVPLQVCLDSTVTLWTLQVLLVYQLLKLMVLSHLPLVTVAFWPNSHCLLITFVSLHWNTWIHFWPLKNRGGPEYDLG